MGKWACICMGHVIVVVVKAAGGLPCHPRPHRAICMPIVPSAYPGDTMEGGGCGWTDTGMRVGGHAGGWMCGWVNVRVGGCAGGWTCRWVWCVVCEQAKERDNQSCCTHL